MPPLKALRGVLVMELVILNHNQVKRMAPELATPYTHFYIVPREELRASTDLTSISSVYCRSTVILGFDLWHEELHACRRFRIGCGGELPRSSLDSDVGIRLSECECEEPEERAYETDNISVNPDMYVTRDK
ncbi:hypothetical protein TNCV_2319921 [Trichonephila clavipes]|nr:hypothetical protein TNCV_2319921 [Trichonephila clavipes]